MPCVVLLPFPVRSYAVLTVQFVPGQEIPAIVAGTSAPFKVLLYISAQPMSVPPVELHTMSSACPRVADE